MEKNKSINIDNEIEIEEIESEVEDSESSPAKFEISTYPADFPLEVLQMKWDNGDITIPDFQREFVWKHAQSSKLIESFLLDLPVPPIYLYKERETQKLLVIDGQQRLKSIFYFFEGSFGDEKQGKKTVFRLKGLNEKSIYHNKAYEDFNESEQRKFKSCVLRAFIVQQMDPKDDTSIYHIFERLNTGGTLLTNQEVRNCVVHGKFNDLLEELNENMNWRKILGKPGIDRRQKDIELILRFFSLQDISKYENPLKDYLTKFMNANRNPEEKWIKKSRDIFIKTNQEIINNLGEKPFHIRRGLNTSALDSVMVAFSRNLKSIPSNIASRYSKLLKNEQFYKANSSATTNVETVKKRFSLAEEYLIKD